VYTQLVPVGVSTTCLAMGYAMNHGNDLPAFCKQVEVKAAPVEQAVDGAVEIPPLLPDE
jgi:hypothetical protein